MDVFSCSFLRILVLAGSAFLAACASNSPLNTERYASVLDMSRAVAVRFTPTLQKGMAYSGGNFSRFEDERVRGAAFKVQAERLDKHNIELSFAEYCRRHEGLLYSRKTSQRGIYEYRCEAYLGGVLFSVLTNQADFSYNSGRACLSFMVLEQKDKRDSLQADIYLQTGAPAGQTLNALAGC